MYVPGFDLITASYDLFTAEVSKVRPTGNIYPTKMIFSSSQLESSDSVQAFWVAELLLYTPLPPQYAEQVPQPDKAPLSGRCTVLLVARSANEVLQ